MLESRDPDLQTRDLDFQSQDPDSRDKKIITHVALMMGHRTGAARGVGTVFGRPRLGLQLTVRCMLSDL